MIPLARTGIAAWDSALAEEYRRCLASEKQEKNGGEAADVEAGIWELSRSSANGDPSPCIQGSDTEAPWRKRSSAASSVTLATGDDRCEDTAYSTASSASSLTLLKKNDNARREDTDGSSTSSDEDEGKEQNEVTRNEKRPGLALESRSSSQELEPSLGKESETRGYRCSSGLESALKLVTRCLRVDGFHVKAYALRAELETRLGQRDRAIADYEAAASIESGDQRPRINQVRDCASQAKHL